MERDRDYDRGYRPLKKPPDSPATVSASFMVTLLSVVLWTYIAYICQRVVGIAVGLPTLTYFQTVALTFLAYFIGRVWSGNV